MVSGKGIKELSIIIGLIGMAALWQRSFPYQRTEGTGTTSYPVIKIASKILDEERTLSIALPEEYESSQKTYPVLYVLDAEGTLTFPRSVSTVRNLNTKGSVTPMIVVGIWNTHRNRDMIPASVPHRPGSGGSEKFLRFIAEELKPYLKRNYRVSDYSILYGMSNSALFAVYAIFENPGTFTAAIASSPMIGHCSDHMKKKAEEFIGKDRLKGRSLFMVYGTKDSPRVTDYVPDLQDYLASHAPDGFRSKVEILEGEGHVPKSSLERGLRFIFSQK